METNKSIAAAFVKAQKDFSPALKSSSNPHFKSKYADLAACVEAVIDALNSNGIAVIQRPVLCDNGVTVETVFVHESGETLSGGVLHVPSQKQDAQGYGSALTYCRRYGLMAACGIAPEDDDGNAAVAAQKAAQKPQAKQAPAVNMDDALVALRESETLESLQAVFGPTYKAATPEQRTTLKTAYDTRKAEIEATMEAA